MAVDAAWRLQFSEIAVAASLPTASASFCRGNFIDDYAVNEIDRNDGSFIFMIEIDGTRMTRMTLRPTVIAECQALLARGQNDARNMGHLKLFGIAELP